MLFLKQSIYGIWRLQGSWLYAKIMLKVIISYTHFADAGVEIDEHFITARGIAVVNSVSLAASRE